MECFIDLTDENEKTIATKANSQQNSSPPPKPESPPKNPLDDSTDSSDDAQNSSDEEPPTEAGSEAQPIQFGRGRYLPLKFQQVECKRAFNNSVLCKSFKPLDEIQDLGSVLHWLKKKLVNELPPILTQYHGLRVWVSMLNN